MKKLVIAAAVLGAFAGTAQAQSSVTLFGVLDANITHLSTGGAELGSRTFMDTSGINTSRLGFRGVEDLGGGLHAAFWLEAGLNNESGTGQASSLGNGATFAGTATGGGGLTFNRRSTVSLIGDSWGEVRVGRDFQPTFWVAANVDPYGYNGIGRIASVIAEAQGAGGPTAVWASNSISYLTPNTLGGFFFQGTYAIGGNPNGEVNAAGENTQHDGDYAGGNFGYKNGPLYASAATSFTHLAQTTSESVVELGNGGVHVSNLGVSYDFGFVKPDFFYQTATVDAHPTDYQTSVAQIGAVVPLGQGEFRASYVHAKGSDYFDGSHANIYSIGYVYNLSKRTALYGVFAHVNNTGDYAFSLDSYTPGPTPGESQSGVQIGVRTSF